MIDVVAAIIEQEGKILLARRAPEGDQPGLWEFPGGKVEPGETQEAALQRELMEELGIYANTSCYVASHQHEVGGRWLHLHAWHVTNFKGKITAKWHSALAWCQPHQAPKHNLVSADLPLLQAFIHAHAAKLTD